MANERIYLNADKSAIVSESEAAFLLAAPGQVIDAETAQKYNLIGATTKAVEQAPEHKAMLSAPENKSLKRK